MFGSRSYFYTNSRSQLAPAKSVRDMETGKAFFLLSTPRAEMENTII